MSPLECLIYLVHDRADLPVRQLAVLGLCLHHKDDPKARQVKLLAADLRISKSAITRTFDGLEAADLAKRQPLPPDRRAAILTLTKKGERLAARLLA